MLEHQCNQNLDQLFTVYRVNNLNQKIFYSGTSWG